MESCKSRAILRRSSSCNRRSWPERRRSSSSACFRSSISVFVPYHLYDASFRIAQRYAACQEPTVRPVDAPVAFFLLVGRSIYHRLVPSLKHPISIVGMKHSSASHRLADLRAQVPCRSANVRCNSRVCRQAGRSRSAAGSHRSAPATPFPPASDLRCRWWFHTI